MTEIDIQIRDGDDEQSIRRRVERVMAGYGLTMRSRGTLKTYPGCIHWHFANGSQKGTLEATFWPKSRRLWFKVQAGRAAPWIERSVGPLKRMLEDDAA